MKQTEKPGKHTITPAAEINSSSETGGKTAKGRSAWGKVFLVFLSSVFVLALLGFLFINGKLNKLNFHEEFETLTQEEVQAFSDKSLDKAMQNLELRDSDAELAESESSGNQNNKNPDQAVQNLELRDSGAELAERESSGNQDNKNPDQAVQNLELRDSGAELAEGEIFGDRNIVNILVCGTDMRIPGTKDQGRCDAAVIVSLNKKTGDVKLISFERSIGVPTPKYGDTKLNSAFNYGGGPYMQETITKCFRVALAGYVHLSYESIAEVFDAIGGIDVELDQSEVYHIGRYVRYDPEAPELKVGMNHLTGWAAYGYCRLRNADDNYARQHRVRNAMQALVEKLKNMSISELNTMTDKVLPLIGTNLSKTQISSLILSAPKFSKATVEQMSVPTKGEGWYYMNGSGEWMLGVDYTEWSQRIRTFILNEEAA